VSCGQNSSIKNSAKDETAEANNYVVKSEFQELVDSAEVQGSILIYDSNQDMYYSNDFEWASIGHLPASTFKIPNSIIALELGIMEHDSTIILWDGQPRWMKAWEKDLMFKDALRLSCVPCFQGIALKIGAQRMDSCLTAIGYPGMKFDSSTLQVFWLEGESKINQFEQIEFLRQFYNSELPISDKTESIIKRMLVLRAERDYILSGKTGWSGSSGGNNGWFVGYAEYDDDIYYFANNISPKGEFDRDHFLEMRTKIVYESFKILGVEIK
jgi:beta-lactamase class D